MATARSSERRSRPSLRGRSAHRTSSSRSRARTGSSWRGTRRARRSSTSRRTPTARSTSSARATSSRRTRTSGSRTSSRSQANSDGSFTYWGATGDFALGDAGRNAIDIYKVTLPAPPKPRTAGSRCPARRHSRAGGCRCVCIGVGLRLRQGQAAQEAQACALLVQHADREPGQGHDLPAGRPAGAIARRKVKTFRNRRRAFTWSAEAREERLLRRALHDQGGRTAARTSATSRCGAGTGASSSSRLRPPLDRAALVEYLSLGRSVFGGRKRKPLGVRFNLAERLRRRRSWSGAAARSFAGSRRRATRRGKSLVQIRLGRKAKRGAYRVTLKAERPGQRQRADAARALPVASRDR